MGGQGTQGEASSSLSHWVSAVGNLIDGSHSVTSFPLLPLLPPNLTDHANSDAYIPRVVSLGPRYHLNRHQLSYMEHHKIVACRRLIDSGELRKDLGSIVDTVRHMDLQVRSFYGIRTAHDNRYDEQNLALMMTTDSLFILDFMFKILYYDNALIALPQISFLGLQILTDAAKLQNQLPVFVLQEVARYMKNHGIDIDVFMRRLPLYFSPFEFEQKSDALTEEPTKEATHLLDMLCDYVSTFLRIDIVEIPMNPPLEYGDWFEAYLSNSTGWFIVLAAPLFLIYILTLLVHEFLSTIFEALEDYCRIVRRISKAIGYVLLGTIAVLALVLCFPLLIWVAFVAYIDMRRAGRAGRINFPRICTATKLRRTGFDFQVLPTDIEHITCTDHALYLPRITIFRNTTEVILRNLVALESCGRPNKVKTVTEYVDLMATLIDTANDVAVLRSYGIISAQDDNLSDEDIARMWKSLLNPFFAAYLKPPRGLVRWLSVSVLKRRRRSDKWGWWRIDWLPNYWEEFKWKYLSSPWLTASLVGGLLLLVMTATQVFCLFHQCSSTQNSSPPQP